MKSLFQAGGALHSENPTYIDRKADREALQAALNGEYLHVMSPRQSGKTSLLKRLAARLNEVSWRHAYIDLSTLMDFPKPKWYAELGKEIASALTPGQNPSIANQIDLRHYLLNIALSWPGNQPRILLLLDEVEGAGKAQDTDGKQFSDTFFMTLRNLYIQRDDYEGVIVIAFAGAVDPNELVKDPDISPFNVGQEINLDDFTKTEVFALTLHLAGLGVQIEEGVHQVIYEWTNGHPYLVQRICIELEKSVHAGVLATITSQDVERVVNQVIINPFNPLLRDKNLKHIGKMLSSLTPQAATLWSRLQREGIISRKEVPDEIYLELFLTGAIKAEENHLVVRNRIYERAFTKATDLKLELDKKKGGEVMDKAVRVFVSSTWQDLQPERKAVEEALHRMQDTTFGGMEYFGSRPETPKEVSLTEVDQSDVYIGIFAHRYGSGITEDEYRRARDLGIPCLLYLKDDDVPVLPSNLERESDKLARLDALKRELKSRHTVSFFKNSDQLATQVVTDLHNLFGSAPSLREKKPIQPGPKFQISITDSQGVVIGDQSNVTQILTGPKPTGQRNFVARSIHQLIQVKGEHRIYLVNKDGTRSWVPDGPTLESLARWEDVELLASWDEIERFPPKLPLPSIVYGIKPWLVKVRGEQDIYLIDKAGIRHIIKDLGSGRSLNERTEVDFFASWKELELFQLGQPLSIIELASGSETNIHSSNTLSTMTDIRLQHLADNIRQDLALLKDYEDAFRFEDDPRRRARYRREIEQLRNSAINYQKEYDELCTLSSLNPPEDMQVIATQLQQMDTKLDSLLSGQSAIHVELKDLRLSVLTHYDASVQSIIATMVERLDQNQLITVLAIQEFVEAGRISEGELQTTLATVQKTLSELQKYQEESRNTELAGNIERISEVINEPRLDVRHRLKITLPIIPLLLAYEGELELSEGLNLEAAWKSLVMKARTRK